MERCQWNTDALRDIVREYEPEVLSDDAVLVIDETGFLKQVNPLVVLVANKLAQKRIYPAHVIAWSGWRRTHPALAKKITHQ